MRSSPFGAKGLLFQGTRTYFESVDLWDRLLDELTPELRAFLEQRFFTGTYYEALVIPELVRVEAQVCGLGITEYLDRRTQWQANRDLRGVYRVVVRVAPAEMTISRLVLLMTQMFNFGAPTVTKQGAGELEVELAGVPERLTGWLRQCLVRYAEICLDMAGSKNVRIIRRATVPDGEVLGTPTVQMGFHLSWKG